MALTENGIRSKQFTKIIGIQSKNSPSNRNLTFYLRISDNVFLPGQPSYDVPNDAY